MNRKKIIYSILKEIEKGEREPHAKDYGLTQEQFVEIAILIKDEHLLNNVSTAGNIVFLNNNKLTMKGIEFLEQNNAWEKEYSGLEEAKDWIKI